MVAGLCLLSGPFIAGAMGERTQQSVVSTFREEAQQLRPAVSAAENPVSSASESAETEKNPAVPGFASRPETTGPSQSALFRLLPAEPSSAPETAAPIVEPASTEAPQKPETTSAPTAAPSAAPAPALTPAPTGSPAPAPTAAPSAVPTPAAITPAPTDSPAPVPTARPVAPAVPLPPRPTASVVPVEASAAPAVSAAPAEAPIEASAAPAEPSSVPVLPAEQVPSASSPAPVRPDVTESKKNKLNAARFYAAARRYNESLVDKCLAGMNSRADVERFALNATDYGLTENLIGTMEVPRLGIELGLYLGASPDNMAKGLAIFGETSLPLGLPGENCSVAGHRGWNGTEVFRNIQMLRMEDPIFVHTLWGELEYRVFDIRIVTPEDNTWCAIAPGRSLITLMTCHPYGQNYQRYIVFAELVKPEETEPEEEPAAQEVQENPAETPTETPAPEATQLPAAAAPQETEAPVPTAEPVVPATAAPTASSAAAPVVSAAEPVVSAAEPVVPATAAPTAVPTVAPTAMPTENPSAVLPAAPSAEPTAAPSPVPTEPPVPAPSAVPTAEPAAESTAEPFAKHAEETEKEKIESRAQRITLVHADGTTESIEIDTEAIAAGASEYGTVMSNFVILAEDRMRPVMFVTAGIVGLIGIWLTWITIRDARIERANRRKHHE